MKQYCVLVVLYKVEVRECPTILSLVKCKEYLVGSELVIWDNSPDALTDEQISWVKDQFVASVIYNHTPSNVSLSSIYNSVYPVKRDFGHFIVLDQDSKFGPEYFEAIGAAKREYAGINLFVPLISHENAIMSPGYFYKFKGKYRQQIDFGVNSTRNMCIITSGMCVSMKYMNAQFPGFNEHLTFYGIDTFFSVEYRKVNEYFFLLKCNFDHSLSQHENETYETSLNRFKNQKKALLELTRTSNILVRLLSKLYVTFLSTKFMVRHKRIGVGSGRISINETK